MGKPDPNGRRKHQRKTLQNADEYAAFHHGITRYYTTIWALHKAEQTPRRALKHPPRNARMTIFKAARKLAKHPNLAGNPTLGKALAALLKNEARQLPPHPAALAAAHQVLRTQ